MKRIAYLPLLTLTLWMSAAAPLPAAEVPTVTVMTTDSFSMTESLVAGFEEKHKIKLRFLKSGDTGVAVNQALLAGRKPLADLFYGVDNTFMSRALEGGIFVPYASPLLDQVPDELKLDPQFRLLPVDYGDVCLNYDKRWFSNKGLAPPLGISDLTEPAYRGMTVVQNPATSSPGLAFLLTTIGRFGEPGYLDFWKRLNANDLLVVNGWKEAYWGEFSAASPGDRPIVVSYASSPPAEVHYAEKPLHTAPTAAVTAAGNCFRQIEFVGILKGCRHPELARRVVDFFLGVPFQEDLPLQMFVFPANRNARLPEVFTLHTQRASEPVTLPAETIAQHRERWIQEWTEAVLR